MCDQLEQGAHRESRMKFPVFSLMKKCIVRHLHAKRPSSPAGGSGCKPPKKMKMGPLRVILRHLKAIQSYIYKVIYKVKVLRKKIFNKFLELFIMKPFTYSVYFS